MSIELVLPMLLFILVGLVVSMDVSGLTLSRAEDLRDGQISVNWWGIYHSFWHAALLATYLTVIHAGIQISPEIKKFLLNLVEALRINLRLEEEYARCLALLIDAVHRHLKLLLGLVALIIVWRTYSAKIADDPSEAKTARLPPLAQLVFNIVELVRRFFSTRQTDPRRLQAWLITQAQAALVAVDMLALAILLKALGMIENTSDIALVLLIILSTVFLCARGMAKYSVAAYMELSTKRRRYRARTVTWIRVTLRLAEPLLIFYFALQLVVLLLQGNSESGASLFAGALLLLCALVRQYGLTEIVRLASVTKPPQTIGANNSAALRPISRIILEILKTLAIGLLIFLGIIVFLIVFALIIRLRPGSAPGEILALDTEIAIAVSGFSGLAAAAKLLHAPFLQWLEDIATTVSKWITFHRGTISFMLIALIIAILGPLYDSLIQRAIIEKNLPRLLDLVRELHVTHEHALQVVLSCLTLLVIGYLFDVADRLHRKRILMRRPTKKQTEELYWEWQHAIVWAMATGLVVWIGKLQRQLGF